MTKVAVCSRSFSRHPILRAELLAQFPDTYFNDDGVSLEGNSLVAFLKPAERAITALEKIDSHVVSHLPSLKVIGKYGVGTDMIDFHALADAGIHFGWTPGVNRRSVSELTLCLMITMLREVPLSNKFARQGIWKQRVGRQLSDQTVGIVGCGNVGKDLVKLLAPFGCKILVNDIVDYHDFYKAHGISPVSLDDLVQCSDVVTIHVPKNSSTLNLFNRKRILQMKQNAILINTARGGIVDETALKEALNDKRLAGAGFDVLSEEPPTDLSLIKSDNFFVTSHLGGSAEEAILAMGRAAIAGLSDYKDANTFIESNKRGLL